MSNTIDRILALVWLVIALIDQWQGNYAAGCLSMLFAIYFLISSREGK